MRIALLYGLLSAICGAYGLSAQAIPQEQSETEQAAKISASTHAARQDQARILASMITGRVNFVEKNRQLEKQISEIKRKRDVCRATFAALNTTIGNHRGLKMFLKSLTSQIGFPLGIEAITQLLDQQTRMVTREIKIAQRKIRKNEKDIRKYEKEKAGLITELEKSQTATKSSAHKSSTKSTMQATPSLTSRTWAWAFGTKPATTESTATESASLKQTSELEYLKFAHTQLLLSVTKATDNLNSCKQQIAELQNERVRLMNEIETVSQEIINRLSWSDVFTNEQDLNYAQKSMQNLRSAYFNLDAIFIREQETQERKHKLLFDIEGMEQTDY